ncbi:helix-turn-helix domain-containing protein [Psychroserpens sp. MEBiC05023]
MNKIFIKNKIKKTTLTPVTSNKVSEEIDKIMSTEKPYTNPNLKIADVAEKLELTTHELSKFVNDNLGKNFTDFINGYRIEEAKQLIATQNKFTIEAIGNLSGFNSKSAFYKAFKKHTDTTPAQYKSRL